MASRHSSNSRIIHIIARNSVSARIYQCQISRRYINLGCFCSGFILCHTNHLSNFNDSKYQPHCGKNFIIKSHFSSHPRYPLWLNYNRHCHGMELCGQFYYYYPNHHYGCNPYFWSNRFFYNECSNY